MWLNLKKKWKNQSNYFYLRSLLQKILFLNVFILKYIKKLNWIQIILFFINTAVNIKIYKNKRLQKISIAMKL